jgi:putative oxidoreductase
MYREFNERSSTMIKAAFQAGRLIFGGYFAYNGLNHFQNRKMMAGYAGGKGVPSAEQAVTGSGGMLLAGGLSVLSGVQPKIGLALIAGFLAGVTPVMHRFWEIDDPQQRMGEQVNFLKNMALMGSALMLMAVPEPWPQPHIRQNRLADGRALAEYVV